MLTVLPIRNGGPGPRYRSMMQNSAQFCMGTDAMNGAPWEPFMGMWYLISGKTMIPGVAGVPAEQRLIPHRGAALAHRGLRLVPGSGRPARNAREGSHADLIVPSGDYFTVPEDEIKDLRRT